MKKVFPQLFLLLNSILAFGQIDITSYNLNLSKTDNNFSAIIANDTIYSIDIKLLKKWSFKTGVLYNEIPWAVTDGRYNKLQLDHDGFIATVENGVMNQILWNGKLKPYKFDNSKYSAKSGEFFGAKGRMGMYINGWVFYKAKMDSFYTPEKIGPFSNGKLKWMYSTERYNLFVSGNEVYIEYFSPNTTTPYFTEHKDYNGRFKLYSSAILDAKNRLWFNVFEGLMYDENGIVKEYEADPLDKIGGFLMNDAQGNILFNGNWSGFYVDATTMESKKIFKFSDTQIGVGYSYKGYNYFFAESHLLKFDSGNYEVLLFDKNRPVFDNGYLVNNAKSMYLYANNLVWVFDKQKENFELIASKYGVVEGFVNAANLPDTNSVWFLTSNLNNQYVIGAISSKNDTLKNYFNKALSGYYILNYGFDKNGNPIIGEFNRSRLAFRYNGFAPRTYETIGSITTVVSIDENDFAILSGSNKLVQITWVINGEQYTYSTKGDYKICRLYYGDDGSLFFYDGRDLSFCELKSNNELALNKLAVNIENIKSIIPISAMNKSFYYLHNNDDLIYRWKFGEINVSDSLNQKFKSVRASSFDNEGNLWLIDTFGLHKIEFKRLFTSVGNMLEIQIDIFPNPVKDQLNILGLEYANYQIYNSQGVVMKSGKNERVINVSNFPKGIYLLKIEDQVKRFIKN